MLVFFRYTSVSIVPSSVLVRRTSRKGNLLFSSCSFVNLMPSVVVFSLCRILSISFVLTIAPTSSTYLSQSLMWGLSVTAFCSKSCRTASARKLDSGEPIGVPDICL